MNTAQLLGEMPRVEWAKLYYNIGRIGYTDVVKTVMSRYSLVVLEGDWLEHKRIRVDLVRAVLMAMCEVDNEY